MISGRLYSSTKQAITQLEAKSLFQEGVSVAGDDILRNVIKEVILPSIVKWANGPNGVGEITIDHLNTFFGLPHYQNNPQFIAMKKALIDTVFIPLAHKYLEHAQTREGGNVVIQKFFDMEFTPPPKQQIKDFFTKILSEIVGQDIYPLLDDIDWEMDAWAVNDVVFNTLHQTLRIFSEVIVSYECDLVLIAGKMSALPEVRGILVDYCPAPPNRIVSLTDFEAGSWYPFDLERGRIKDAKTTVVVGAAVWFFAERLGSLRNFGLRSHRDLLEKSPIFIGQYQNRKVRNSDLVFPKSSKNLTLAGHTNLGARRIDCEDSHANVLYEVFFGGIVDYTPPISVNLETGTFG